ncbi:hypothetical protein AAFF_G00120940 [Aldrovandia affinis]|uniref:Uncharacterized protein n=1 Tax=Aldrovandia affinis TaxID=143900 RepID=A0AAD7RS58_9TELE|nr:hypothetical protein AAFF_G00120940 [Aldrovandia affinis]
MTLRDHPQDYPEAVICLRAQAQVPGPPSHRAQPPPLCAFPVPSPFQIHVQLFVSSVEASLQVQLESGLLKWRYSMGSALLSSASPGPWTGQNVQNTICTEGA